MASIIFFLIWFIVVLPIGILYSTLSWAYVASILWNWFIIGVIPNAPVFTIPQLAGLIIVIGLFTKNHTPSLIKKQYRDESTEWISLVFGPWMMLFCGWIIHLFVH